MKIRNLSKYLIISVLLLLSAIILFACGPKETPREYTASANGSVVEEIVGGKTAYKAIPDKWHEFLGWFNGNRKYSEEEVLIVNKNTPTKMEARFATSAKQAFNRHLESFYNDYVQGEAKEGEYFNYNITSTLNVSKNDESYQKDVLVDGYIDFEESSQFSFEIKDENKTDFAFYYDDNAENGAIYLQIGEDKYSWTDIGLLTNLILSLPQSSQGIWNLENLISDEKTRTLVTEYFGAKNPMGFVNIVQNYENTSIINLSYHKILNLLKNYADSSSDASMISKLIHSLTCEYDFSHLPEMILTITTTYQNLGNVEYVKDIQIDFNLNRDYVVNFDGKKYTIPQMDASLKIENFNFEFSNQANGIDQEKLSSFPQPEMNMINVHADGEVDFISQGETESKIVDKYTVEFDADLNPLALIAFKKGEQNSYDDIEWEKLGFLSFKISLVQENDADAYQTQQLRHNQNFTSMNNRFGYEYTDYINILIDTKNNGANAYIYLALYTPYTPYTRSYIFNHSFNIPSLLNMLDGQENEEFDSKAILGLLAGMVAGGVQLGEGESWTGILQDLLSEFLGLFNVDKEIIDNSFTSNDNGFDLSLPQIRTKIREYEQETIKSIINLGTTELNLDKKIFGDDEVDGINHISVKLNPSIQNSVVKNADGDYLSKQGEVIIDQFNSAHPVIVKISDKTGISEITSSMTMQSLLSLIGSQTTIQNAILSDGSEVSEFINNKGQSNNTADKKINMIIEDIQILSQEGDVAQIKVVLQFKDYSNGIGNFGDVVYENLSIPYGLIVFETSVELL